MLFYSSADLVRALLREAAPTLAVVSVIVGVLVVLLAGQLLE